MAYSEGQAKTEITADSTVRAIARLAHSDLRKFYDEHGDLKPVHSLPDARRAVIFRHVVRRRHSECDYFAARYPACICPCQRLDGSLGATSHA